MRDVVEARAVKEKGNRGVEACIRSTEVSTRMYLAHPSASSLQQHSKFFLAKTSLTTDNMASFLAILAVLNAVSGIPTSPSRLSERQDETSLWTCRETGCTDCPFYFDVGGVSNCLFSICSGTHHVLGLASLYVLQW